MKSFIFWLKFHWSFFPKGPIDNNPGLDNALAPNMQQVIIWTKADPVN